MSLRRLAPRFVDWRLSRIDEEVDRVSCCSSDLTARTPSPPLPPPPPLLLDDDPAASDTSTAHNELSAEDETLSPAVAMDDPSAAVIYSNADEWRKQLVERSAADDEREALRFIKEKYDSLGKIGVDKALSREVAAPQTPNPTTTQVEEQSTALYENVNVACSQTGAGGRKVTAECADCLAERRGSNSTPQTVCCDAKQAEAIQRRQLKPIQQQNCQHPPCQCHHDQQPQQEAEMQNHQRLLGECIPRSPLSDGELMQIDLFYRSYKSSVYVCTCMATLSFSRPVIATPAKSKSMPKLPEDYDDGVWACVRAGIPVIVRDNGDGRRRRRVCVLLAERGTGFELWRAPVDRLSDYAVTAIPVSTGNDPSAVAVSCSQHTMKLSVDSTMSVTARLVFDEQVAADEFHRQMIALTTADSDSASTKSGVSGQTKKKRRGKAAVSISKADISQPCCFSHVTRLERGVPCRGRPGLHIVVASGRQASSAAVSVDSPPISTHSRTTAANKHCQSSFKGNLHV